MASAMSAAGGGLRWLPAAVRPAGFLAGDFFVAVGIERVDEAVDDGGEFDAVGGVADGFGFRLAHAAVEAGEAGGERGDEILVGAAEGHGFQEFVKGDVRLAFERAGFDLRVIGDADGIDDHEAVLGFGVGRDAAQIVGGDDADAAAFHLLEVIQAAHVAHEEDDFERADVGAGGDHVHGDGDAGIVGGAELS